MNQRSTEARLRVGVLGAGIAGLAAARELVDAGHEVAVFDKGRGPGGRASSRGRERFQFDHGAQYFTARSAGFRERVARWIESGVAGPWKGRIVALRDAATTPAGTDTRRYVGVPKMSAIPKYLARDLPVHCRARVSSVDHGTRGWALRFDDGHPSESFDRLVVTAPPPQAAQLLRGVSPLSEEAAQVTMRPCWAALLGFDEPLPLEFDGAFCEDSMLSWVARNSSKPGRPAGESWVLHAGPAWSEENAELAPEQVVVKLLGELARITGQLLPPPCHRDAQFWKYALGESELRGKNPTDAARGLVLAGDAYFGGRVEGAYLSGLDAAVQLCA